jgi:hypothetical protein
LEEKPKGGEMKHIYKFDTDWFERQFGERPKRSLFDIVEDIHATEHKLSRLLLEQRETEIYMAHENGALKSFVNTIYNIKRKGSK